MSDLNVKHNRVVCFDIPVGDLDRATAFYAAILNVKVEQETFEDFRFSVIEHSEGNGGCLVLDPDAVSSDKGILLYMNVDGRIRDAVAKVQANGGQIAQEIHSIGPHGYRALVIDSEGNRIALHSESDA